MILRKILPAASALALMVTPAWALANEGSKHAPSSTPVGPPSTTPNNTDNPGAANRHSGDHSGNGSSNGQNQGNQPDKPNHPEHPKHPGHPAHPEHPSHPGKPGHPGKSHKCMAHNVAYVVSGTLVKQTLTKNTDGTYSGTVEVTVTHTNHHAAGDQGMTKTYTLTSSGVALRVADINNDGSVGLDDLQTGDRTKVIGKITTLSKRCDQTGFTAQLTIRKVIFHAPAK
jgi:hypothetical protein